MNTEPIETRGLQTGAEVELPSGLVFGELAFGRLGDDLILTHPDGGETFLEGYFSGLPPMLVTPEGARLAGATAARLAGPPEDARPPGGVAGYVERLTGEVTALRVDGTRVRLAPGDPIRAGDVLETGDRAAIGVLLEDGGALALAGEGRLVLDEMIYDPATGEGSLKMTLLKGVLTFATGEIGRHDPDAVILVTPLAGIGIRGAQIGIDFADGRTLDVTSMVRGDGYFGEIRFNMIDSVRVLGFAHLNAFIGAFHKMRGEIRTVEEADVAAAFRLPLSHLPGGDAANTYGVEPISPVAGESSTLVTDAESGDAEAMDAEFIAVSGEDGATEEASDAELRIGIDAETAPPEIGRETARPEERRDAPAPEADGTATEGDGDGAADSGPTIDAPAEEIEVVENRDEDIPALADTTLSGGGGDDTLMGGAGDDMLIGGGGDDRLEGGAGDDRLLGGGGGDTLIGGAGDDWLRGSGGDDLFLFRPGDETGSDTVADFKVGDVLRFEGAGLGLEDLAISQSGRDTVITIGGHDMDVTLSKVDAHKLAGYSITEDAGDAIVIRYEDDTGG